MQLLLDSKKISDNKTRSNMITQKHVKKCHSATKKSHFKNNQFEFTVYGRRKRLITHQSSPKTLQKEKISESEIFWNCVSKLSTVSKWNAMIKARKKHLKKVRNNFINNKTTVFNSGLGTTDYI